MRKLGHTLFISSPPVHITFGNGTQSISYYHARLGGWIGNIHCIDTAEETLLSIDHLEEQFYSIYIHRHILYILSPKHEIVVSIVRCPETKLYYANISNPNFLSPTPPEHLPPSLPTSIDIIPPTSAGARKRGPTSKVTIAEVMWLHYRMNHPSRSVMAKALRDGAWIGVQLSATDIEAVLGSISCVVCALAKLNRLPINLGTGIRPTEVGHTVSIDYKPATPVGIGGYTGFYLFCCCLTGFLHGFLVKTKTGLAPLIEQVKLFYALHGHTMRVLRFDAGSVENSARVDTALQLWGITPEPTLPEQQYADPVERQMQTVIKGVSTMMIAQFLLPAMFWPYAFLDFIHTRNYTPNTATDNVAPITCVTTEIPDLSKRFKFKFGSPIVSTVMNRKGQLAKHGTFVERNEFGITLGSTKGKNGGTLLHIPARGPGTRVYHRSDIHLLRLPEPTQEQQLLLKAKILDNEKVAAENPSEAAVFLSPGDDSWLAQYTKGQISIASRTPHDNPPLDDISELYVHLSSMSSTLDEPMPAESNTLPPTIMSEQPTLPYQPPIPPFEHPAQPSEEGVGEISLTIEESSSMSTVLSYVTPPLISTEAPANVEDITTNPTEEITPDPPTIPPPTARKPKPPTPVMNMRTRSQNHAANIGRPWTHRDEATWNHRLERERMAFDRLNSAERATYKEGWFGTSVHKPWVMPPCMRRKCNAIAKQSPARKTNKKQVSISLKQAQASPDWSRYEAAIGREHATLDSLRTGDTVDPSTVTGIILPSRYIFKIKRDGTYKCRLVVLGNLERKRESMFSPTANDKSLRLLLSLSVNLNLTLKGYDIYGAFCNPTLDRLVHIRLPDGRIWRLNKALYGLQDSPKLFYEDVSSLLLSKGYMRCDNDPCMFHKTDHRGYLMAVIHVDDFAVASDNEELHEELREALLSKYSITSNDLDDFLGFNIFYDEVNKTMTLTMPKLLTATINEFLSSGDDKSARTPMSDAFNDEDQDNSHACDSSLFLSLLGKLIYLVKCRPDIAYAVSRMSCRSDRCTVKDWTALLRVLRYLRATRDFGITFSQGRPNDVRMLSTIFCYADAAFNAHADSKSHSGYCISLGGPDNGMFYFRSFKQSNVSLSSTESEINAAVEATKEIIWLRALLQELGFPQFAPTVLYADNKSMITLCTEYSGNHKRVKHYLNRINFMLEQVKTGVVHIEYLPSEDHKADGLTKPLQLGPFTQSTSDLMGV